MCGRYASPDHNRLEAEYGLRNLPPWHQDLNLAPTDSAPIVRLSESRGGRVGELAHFGLLPGWMKAAKAAFSLINARAETLTEKPAYRRAFERRRCIVPAEAFYEWRTEAGARQPYRFARQDGHLLSMAGLWEFAERDGAPVFSFSIITVAATQVLAEYHDRMPAIVEPPEVDAWLESGGLQLLRPSGQPLTVRRVSRALNRPGVKDPAAINEE